MSTVAVDAEVVIKTRGLRPGFRTHAATEPDRREQDREPEGDDRDHGVLLAGRDGCLNEIEDRGAIQAVFFEGSRPVFGASIVPRPVTAT